jgi:hypothetical protein
MKTSGCLLVTLLLLFVFSLSNAQTTNMKLNQKELVGKFVGTWQTEPRNDTIEGVEIEKYGQGFLASDIRIVKGNKTYLDKCTAGYSKKDDNYKMFILFPNGSYMTRIASFVSENVFVQTTVQNLDPAKVSGKLEMTFNSPNTVSCKFMNAEGKVTEEAVLTRAQ